MVPHFFVRYFLSFLMRDLLLEINFIRTLKSISIFIDFILLNGDKNYTALIMCKCDRQDISIMIITYSHDAFSTKT